MKRLLLVAAAAAAVLVPTSLAGGWATVQLSAVPGAGTKAGTPMGIDITVLQHGRTPLGGVTPVFRIRDEDGALVREYEGVPAGKPGVYHVDVEFPSAGTFTYEVYDGFGAYGGARTHTYAPVTIGPAPSGSDGGVPTWVWIAAPLGALVLAAALVVSRRRLRTIASPA